MKKFSDEKQIPFPLLSDVDSEVIRRYGILNDQIGPDDAFLYGLPYPGVFVCDEDGRVVAKFFHDSYKKRESPEMLIDAALGHIELSEETPRAETADEEVKITAVIHGGKGTLRQGIRRELVVRFEMSPGLHIYGEPVPEGLVATQVEMSGPPGLEIEDLIAPPTTPLHLSELDADLQVWSGTVDLRIPFYPVGELASETRPLDWDSVPIEVKIRYQACNDETCLLPQSKTLRLDVPLDVIDVPNLSVHTGHGQREGTYSAAPQMLRLIARKVARRPFSTFKFMAKMIRLNRAARRRARQANT